MGKAVETSSLCRPQWPLKPGHWGSRFPALIHSSCCMRGRQSPLAVASAPLCLESRCLELLWELNGSGKMASVRSRLCPEAMACHKVSLPLEWWVLHIPWSLHPHSLTEEVPLSHRMVWRHPHGGLTLTWNDRNTLKLSHYCHLLTNYGQVSWGHQTWQEGALLRWEWVGWREKLLLR